MFAPAQARAQEIQITGPLRCCAVRQTPQPSPFEWTNWVAGGVTSEARALVGVGLEGSTAVASYLGFPSRKTAELRLGPWAQGSTDFAGAALEGGLGLGLGSVGTASFGAFGLRLGAGARSIAHENHAELVATLTYGVRWLPGRYQAWDGCHDLPPARVAFGSVARGFVTLRADPDLARASGIVGVEVTPALFHSYDPRRIVGGAF